MRKIKLLPLLGISATCATFAPLALTGCNASSSTRMVDLMNVYIPSIEKAKPFEQTMTESYLADWYFSTVANRPEVYEQDFYYGHSLTVSYLSQAQYINMTSASAKISDISFSIIKSLAEVSTAALSCTIEYKYAGYPGQKSIDELGLPQSYLNTLFEGQFKFQLKNVPMRLYWYSGTEPEYFVPGWATQILVSSYTEIIEGIEVTRYAIDETYDNLWSISEDANVTVTDEWYEEGVYRKDVWPFHTQISAKTNAEFKTNINGQDIVTKIPFADIVSSHYMARLNEEGQ